MSESEAPVEPAASALVEAALPTRKSPNDRFGAILDLWVDDCIRNTPASRDTDVWNHLTASALPELRRRLADAD